MRRLSITLCLLLFSSVCTAQTRAEDAYVADDGEIVIRYFEPTFVNNITVISPGEYLIPVPPGDNTATIPNWTFNMNNTPGVITFFDPPLTGPTLEGILPTGIFYDPPQGVFDLEVIASFTSDIGTRSPTLVCSDGPCPIPEPASALMLFAGMGFLSLLRRRR